MAWESALDRLILRQIHFAEEGTLHDAELRAILRDFLTAAQDRPESWFHAGYARTLLGIDLPDPPCDRAAAARWFAFGRLKGHVRRGEASWVADVADDEPLLLDLLQEPAIAAQVLPTLMRCWFHDGSFERAAVALELIETLPAAGDVGVLVEAALIDLLARIERRAIAPDQEGTLRRAVQRVMRMERFDQLCRDDRARFQTALGQSHLRTGEWGEAREAFDAALELATPGTRGARRIHLLHALARLRVFDLARLTPEAERPERAAALAELVPATDGPDAIPEALLARGMLHYEARDYGAAAPALDAAVRIWRREAESDETLFARARYFLGASLLAGGVHEESRNAARLIEGALERVDPDVASFYAVYDPLKVTDEKVALRFLDAIDLGRGASAENLLLVALEYQSLGEPGPALRAAQRVLDVAVDLDQRLDAFKVALSAHNMQGNRDEARGDYFEIRELLLRRGAFEELERTLGDEALVGQALDHLEIKCELADLYEEMEGKDWDLAQLKLQIARAFRAKKETEDLRQAQGLLREVGIQFPELAAEDLGNIEKLLALHGVADEGDTATSPMDALARSLGHRPRILVAGGNERQRKHHPRLAALAAAWDFEATWLMTNYASPQKIVSQIAAKLEQGLDILVLLHWNRHETTEPALEKARQAGVAARTLFYAGFTSLQVCLEEFAAKLAVTR